MAIIRESIARDAEDFDERKRKYGKVLEEINNFISDFSEIRKDEKQILELKDSYIAVDSILKKRRIQLLGFFNRLGIIENVREDKLRTMLENLLVYISLLEDIIKQKKRYLFS